MIGKRKTHEEFVKEIYELVGDEYSVIGKHINANTKLEVYHSICLKSYEVAPSHFLRGDRCPWCNGNKKRTTESFIAEVNDLVGNEYTILEKYINANTKIKIRHNVCNHTYDVTPAKFLKGRRCPNCNKYRPISKEEFLEKLSKIGNGNYSLVGEFTRMNDLTILQHNKCGYLWNVSPTCFLQ